MPVKVVSKEPFSLSRAMQNLPEQVPATTIFPSGCTATASAVALSEPATDNRNLPLPGVPGPSKLVSSEPSALSRAMQKNVPSVPAHLPARTIFPSDCRAIA